MVKKAKEPAKEAAKVNKPAVKAAKLKKAAKKAAKLKKAAKKAAKANEPPTLAQSNKARLKLFKKSRSSKQDNNFVLKFSHPYMDENDICAVEGTLKGVEYVLGYTTQEKAKQAIIELNKQYFK